MELCPFAAKKSLLQLNTCSSNVLLQLIMKQAQYVLSRELQGLQDSPDGGLSTHVMTSATTRG